MAFKREPVPIIVGVVERGNSRALVETVLLERVFRGLRENGRIDYFNQMYGRSDLTTPRAMLVRLSYTDKLLLGMVMKPAHIRKHGQSTNTAVCNYSTSQHRRKWQRPSRLPGPWADDAGGFPEVEAAYLHTSRTTDPLRIEVFPALGEEQIHEAASRVHLYARLLPGYGFPIGLDIADRYASVPAWLTEAYGKLIRQHLSASLMSGQLSDAQMRRVCVNAIYMTHRDWLFRPDVRSDRRTRSEHCARRHPTAK